MNLRPPFRRPVWLVAACAWMFVSTGINAQAVGLQPPRPDPQAGLNGPSLTKSLPDLAQITQADLPADHVRIVPTSSSLMSRFWELDAEHKQGTFSLRSYRPNYVMPAHFTTSMNRTPDSPTRGPGPTRANFKNVDAKFQISLRAKVLQDFGLPNADLWVAFTHRAFWQLWNSKESSPFRSSDYEPEIIYVMPVPERLGTLPMGLRFRMAQLGFAHQSNGQSNPLSRSWNRFYAAAAVERGEFGLLGRINHRVTEKEDDDNPDLTRYIGDTEIAATWNPGLATAMLTWRTHLRSASRGSVQLDWSYPIDRTKPNGGRWYVQLFHGYGETLLDYNHRQTTLGLGMSFGFL